MALEHSGQPGHARAHLRIRVGRQHQRLGDVGAHAAGGQEVDGQLREIDDVPLRSSPRLPTNENRILGIPGADET